MAVVASLSDKISLTVLDMQRDRKIAESYKIGKVPALVVEGKKDFGLRFYGIPSGYKFNSLLHAIENVSRGSAQLPGVIREDLNRITKEIHTQVFVTPGCPHYPGAVKTALDFAMYSGKTRADMVEISEFPELARKSAGRSVPKVVINESINFVGWPGERAYLEMILEANA